MKNYFFSAIALLAFLSSCTPMRQVAETSSDSSVPAFKTWVDPNEKQAERPEQAEPAVPSQAKKESLAESYANFRKDTSPTKATEKKSIQTKSTETTYQSLQKSEVERVIAQSQQLLAAQAKTQPLPAMSHKDAKVIRVYIDPNEPVVVDIIKGNAPATEEQHTRATRPVQQKEKLELEYKPNISRMAAQDIAPQRPAKTQPLAAKQAEDPGDFMLSLMTEELDEAQADLSVMRDGAVATAPVKAKAPIAPRYISVTLPDRQIIEVDEAMLKRWEKKIVDARMGIESPQPLPRWLLQGLEWITHAPKTGDKRSDMIMPLYRQLEQRGHLDDINLKQMTPVQVVRKIRILVDELKATNGHLSMNY